MEEREDGGKGEKTINDSMTKSSSILHPPSSLSSRSSLLIFQHNFTKLLAFVHIIEGLLRVRQ